MALFIGIEGVGMRQSVALAANERGEIVGSARIDYGISLHATRREILQSRLRKLIQEVAYSAGRRVSDLADATVCIGLAGVAFPYEAEVDLPREFEELQLVFKKLICTGDAEIVFASHALSEIGGAIICHMGSAGYVTRGAHREDRFRIGGWGPALGGEGSGYWIGRTVLKTIGEAFEKRKSSESALWTEVSKWLSEPDEEIPSWRFASKTWNRLVTDYSERKIGDLRPVIFAFAHEVSRYSVADWREVASSLVTPTVRAAEQFDHDAINVLSAASGHLRYQFLEALKMSAIREGKLKLVLYGGVLTHNSYFSQLVIDGLEKECGLKLEVISPNVSGTLRPACGALLFALGDSTTSTLKLPTTTVISALQNDPAILKPHVNLTND